MLDHPPQTPRGSAWQDRLALARLAWSGLGARWERVREKIPPLPVRSRRLLAPVGAGLLVAVCVLVLLGLGLMRASPAWWRTVLREDPATIRLAKDVEARITNAIYEPHPIVPSSARHAEPGTLWNIEVDAPSANAWLNVRLPMWLANQKEQFRWPRDMTDLQVDFREKRVTLGASVRAGDRVQVLTATIDPYVDDTGRLWLPASGVSLGRLDIPGPWVVRAVRAQAARYIPQRLRDLPETQMLFRAFQGEIALVNNAVFKLGDGRKVRVLDIQTRDGSLVITCRTERD